MKKKMREGTILDDFDEINMSSYVANVIDVEKVAQVEKDSDYIYPPLKRNFKSFVRITSFVVVAYRKFKKKMVLAKTKRGEKVSDGSTLVDLNFPPAKFISFAVILNGKVQDQKINDSKSLCDVFQAHNVNVRRNLKNTEFADGRKYLIDNLTEEQLSEGLNYIFKRATKEIFKYHDKKFIEKRGIEIDGVLFSKDRILEGQELQIVGGLERTVDLHSLTGISFRVPLIYKNSPLAVAIGEHLHYDVIKHMGAESVYRLSLQYMAVHYSSR